MLLSWSRAQGGHGHQGLPFCCCLQQEEGEQQQEQQGGQQQQEGQQGHGHQGLPFCCCQGGGEQQEEGADGDGGGEQQGLELIKDSPCGLHLIGTRKFYETSNDALKTAIIILLIIIAGYDFIKKKKDFLLFPLLVVLALIIISAVSTLLEYLVYCYGEGIRFFTIKGLILNGDLLASIFHLVTGFTALIYTILKKDLPLWLDIWLLGSAGLSLICLFVKYSIAKSKCCTNHPPKRSINGEIRMLGRMVNDSVMTINDIEKAMPILEKKLEDQNAAVQQNILKVNTIKTASASARVHIAQMREAWNPTGAPAPAPAGLLAPGETVARLAPSET